MATDLTNTSTSITADGSYFYKINANRPSVVSFDYTTPGTGGSIEIRNAQDRPYRESDGTTALAVAYNSTVVGHKIDPTGDRVYLEATGVTAGGSVVKPHVAASY